MPLYQFVVKETAQGKAHHSDPPPNNYLNRRETARQKGDLISAKRQGAVAENYIDGFGYFTWVVDAPSMTNVIALIRECERHGFVELYWGPRPAITGQDIVDLEGFSADIKRAFPDK
jgi:hypothetical protein